MKTELPDLTPGQQKRLNELLKATMPASYNSFSRRYDRALEVLQHVRNELPGDARDGELTYTEAEARECLATYARTFVPAHSYRVLLTEAVSAARSEVARDAGKNRVGKIHRNVTTGKFRGRKKL